MFRNFSVQGETTEPAKELGWRGYLLPKLMPLGEKKALLISGLIWGLWHAPQVLKACFR